MNYTIRFNFIIYQFILVSHNATVVGIHWLRISTSNLSPLVSHVLVSEFSSGLENHSYLAAYIYLKTFLLLLMPGTDVRLGDSDIKVFF